MSNGYWKTYGKTGGVLHNQNGDRIALLTRSYDDLWDVEVFPAIIGCQFNVEATDIKEAELKTAKSIYYLCTTKIKNLAKIRDCLPIKDEGDELVK